MNILLIGNGYWGNAYVSTFKNHFQQHSLDVGTRQDWKLKIDQKPDGVIVCTPPDSHIEIASYALQQNIPVMIEKPLALSLNECEKLKEFSANAFILVNHTHLFSEGYQRIKSMLKSEMIDKIDTFGWGINRNRSYSQLWDYGPHDLSMIFDLLENSELATIRCWKHNQYHIEMTFREDENTIYTTSTVGKEVGSDKVRKIAIKTSGIDVIYDDVSRPSTHTFPLTNAIKVFLDGICGTEDDRFGIDLSLKIVKALEMCEVSMMDNSSIITV